MLAVNVNWAGATVTSPVSEETTEATTSEDGWVLSTTVNESVPPVSVVPVEPSDSVVEIPGESLSEVVTVTVWSASGSNVLSLDASTIDTVTAVVWLPSVRLSSTPVTVTVCAAFQFDDVNVNWAGDTVTSPVSADETLRTTSVAGCASRTAVNVAVDPASVTVALVPDRVKPAVSSSEVVTDTVESATESYASADEASTTDTVTVVVWVPSITLSSMPVTVTVWAVSQFEFVNVNDAGDTVTSPVSVDPTDMTTSDAGWASSTTVNESVDPASDTAVDPPDNATVTPAPAPVPRLPDESNFKTNTSCPPFEVRLVVPEPGSKSTVLRKVPVVYTLPDESAATE